MDKKVPTDTRPIFTLGARGVTLRLFLAKIAEGDFYHFTLSTLRPKTEKSATPIFSTLLRHLFFDKKGKSIFYPIAKNL